MKYFVLTHTGKYDGETRDFYLKGKSRKHIKERVERYSDGALCTSKGTLFTSNVNIGFLKEVRILDYPYLTKQDFGIINENQSYSKEDLWEEIEARETKKTKNNVIEIKTLIKNK